MIVRTWIKSFYFNKPTFVHYCVKMYVIMQIIQHLLSTWTQQRFFLTTEPNIQHEYLIPIPTKLPIQYLFFNLGIVFMVSLLMLEIVAVSIDTMFTRFCRPVQKFDKLQFRNMRIFWFIFLNYNFHSCWYIKVAKTGRSGRIGIKNF